MPAIPFITLNEEHRFEVSAEAAQFLDRVDAPLAIVAAAGKYRTGKSFFLNRVLLGLNSSNSSTEGFGVGNTVQACTKGLWMHTEMLGVPQTDGSTLNVLVVDTEGMGATSATETHDSRIFSLALLVSSYFIYNSVGTIDEQALSALSLVANISKLVRARSAAPRDGSSADSILTNNAAGGDSGAGEETAAGDASANGVVVDANGGGTSLRGNDSIAEEAGRSDSLKRARPPSFVAEPNKCGTRVGGGNARVNGGGGGAISDVGGNSDEVLAAAEIGELFPKLLWLVRDFSLRLVDSSGSAMSENDYLEEALDEKPSSNGENNGSADKNRLRALLRAYFPRRQCATLVRPVADENELQRVDALPDAALRAEFRKGAARVRSAVLRQVTAKRALGGRPVSGRGLLRLCRAYVDAFNRGVAPVIRDSWALLAEIQFRDAYESSEKTFEEAVERCGQRAGDPAAVRRYLKEAEAVAHEVFNRESPEREGPLFEQFSAKLSERVGRGIEAAAEHNERLLGVLAESILRQNVDENRDVLTIFSSVAGAKGRRGAARKHTNNGNEPGNDAEVACGAGSGGVDAAKALAAGAEGDGVEEEETLQWKEFVENIWRPAEALFFEQVGESAGTEASWSRAALPRLARYADLFVRRLERAVERGEAEREQIQANGTKMREAVDRADRLESDLKSIRVEMLDKEAQWQAERVRLSDEVQQLANFKTGGGRRSVGDGGRGEGMSVEEMECELAELREQVVLERRRRERADENARSSAAAQASVEAEVQRSRAAQSEMARQFQEQVTDLHRSSAAAVEQMKGAQRELQRRAETAEAERETLEADFEGLAERCRHAESLLKDERARRDDEERELRARLDEASRSAAAEQFQLLRAAKDAEARLAVREEQLKAARDKLSEVKVNVEAERARDAVRESEEENERLVIDLCECRRLLDEERATTRRLERQLRESESEFNITKLRQKMDFEVELAHMRASSSGGAANGSGGGGSSSFSPCSGAIGAVASTSLGGGTLFPLGSSSIGSFGGGAGGENSGGTSSSSRGGGSLAPTSSSLALKRRRHLV